MSVRSTRLVQDRHRNTLLAAIAVMMAAGALVYASGLLVPVALALLAWLTFNPLVRWLAKRRVPEALSATVITLGIAALGSSAVYMASGPVSRYAQNPNAVSAELRQKLGSMRRSVEEVVEAGKAIEKAGAELTGNGDGSPRVVVERGGLLTALVDNVRHFFTTVIAALVLLFFLLASGSHFHRRLLGLFPRFSDKRRALMAMVNTESDVSRYIFTVAAINSALGAAVALVLWQTGMPSPVSWGVTAAILNFVPYVGALVGVGMVAAAAILEFDRLDAMLLPPAGYLLCTFLEGQFITPKLLGQRFNLHPVMILLSVAVWGWLWGFVGAVVAVPFLVILNGVCAHTGRLRALTHFMAVQPSWRAPRSIQTHKALRRRARALGERARDLQQRTAQRERPLSERMPAAPTPHGVLHEPD